MVKTVFLKCMAAFTAEAVKEMMLPTALQKGEQERRLVPPGIYLMRIPSGYSAGKKAPYILHQITSGSDTQSGGPPKSTLELRTVFCVYNEDEQEGGMMLLELMERLRIAMLKAVVIGEQFTLDTATGIESAIYPDDTAPYYVGEMVSTWKIPAVERDGRALIS